MKIPECMKRPLTGPEFAAAADKLRAAGLINERMVTTATAGFAAALLDEVERTAVLAENLESHKRHAADLEALLYEVRAERDRLHGTVSNLRADAAARAEALDAEVAALRRVVAAGDALASAVGSARLDGLAGWADGSHDAYRRARAEVKP